MHLQTASMTTRTRNLIRGRENFYNTDLTTIEMWRVFSNIGEIGATTSMSLIFYRGHQDTTFDWLPPCCWEIGTPSAICLAPFYQQLL